MSEVEKVKELTELIGQYGVQVATTGELAPSKELAEALALLSQASLQPSVQEPVATTLHPDRGVLRLSLEDWKRLGALPVGTKLYASPLLKAAPAHEIRSLVADDSFAASFQSIGQYRRNVLSFIDRCVLDEPDNASHLPQAAQLSIAAAIKYPDEWDTAAYPTLESALDELAAWHKASALAAHPPQDGDKDANSPDEQDESPYCPHCGQMDGGTL